MTDDPARSRMLRSMLGTPTADDAEAEQAERDDDSTLSFVRRLFADPESTPTPPPPDPI